MDKKNLFKGSTTSILFTQEIKEKENQTDENIHKILFKKYEIKNKIGKTSSIQIYEGLCLSNQTPVIIKMESRSNVESYLELEALNLYLFKDLGIPKIITTGKTKTSIILIEEKLGPSLYHLFIENKRKFSLNEICCIGIQCIERLKGIHSKNYVHRNIKPENFKIGLKDPHVIYLQNFYLCEKFKSSTTNKHVKLSLSNKIVGTERYGSVDALRGLRQGRKDDLESLCYMLIYFFLGKLPWQDIKAESDREKYKKLLNEKKKFNIDNYKDIISKEFRTIFKLIKNLKFDEQPKYNLYIRLLQKIREENQCFDQNDFFWIKNNKNNNFNIKKNNIKTKKEGFRERLYLKLNTMAKTEIRPVLENDKDNNDIQIGDIYIEEEYSDNDSFNVKTDFHKKISMFLDNDNNDKQTDQENEKEKEENDEENKINLNDSKSSNSSIDTKVYKLNDPIKNFLKNQTKDDNVITPINNNSEKNESSPKGEVVKSNSIKNNNNLNDIIDENVEEENNSSINCNQTADKEENKITIQGNKIDSVNNNDNITTNNSNLTPNSKTGSVTLTNELNMKENTTKGNGETPSLIIVKKNSNEINMINKEKRISVDVKKKENRFGQIMGPEMEYNIHKSGKVIKDKDKDCNIF